MAENPKVFRHAGLLIDEPPGSAGLLFIQSSDIVCVILPRETRIANDIQSRVGHSAGIVFAKCGGLSVVFQGIGRPLWLPKRKSNPVKTAGKTPGEIATAVGEGINRFEQDYLERGPQQIHAPLINDLLAVRFQDVLTAAEQNSVKTPEAVQGRDLLKQVRTHLIKTARPVLESTVKEIIGVRVLCFQHDISSATGEEVVFFTLAEAPCSRETTQERGWKTESELG